MPYDDLRDFVRALEKRGELKRISVRSRPASGNHRIRRPQREDRRPGVSVREAQGLGHVPVLINAFASAARMELALEVDAG